MWGTKNLVVTLDPAGTGVDLSEKLLPVMPDELKKYFEQYGDVLAVKLCRSKKVVN